MIRLPDLIALFHSLIGLCAGWLMGSSRGVMIGVGFAMAGAVLGWFAGFLAGYLPKSIRLIAANIPRKHRVLAMLFAVCGVGLGIAFWSACLNCVGF
jgi:hypothetical protein